MFSAIFINMPVANLEKSLAFFKELGFGVNPKFTDGESACLIVTPNISVMLSDKAKFESFVAKDVAPAGSTEMLVSIACDSADRVRDICSKAHSLGAEKVNEPEDIGFMFSWAFKDLDGHLWDFFWMDPTRLESEN